MSKKRRYCQICNRDLGEEPIPVIWRNNKPICEFCEINLMVGEAKQKDQRISELEKVNKTAVKEFAEEFKKLCFNYGEFDDILCYRNNACKLIDRLLKERGIE